MSKDRTTLSLAALSAITAGAVLVQEAYLERRRRKHGQGPELSSQEKTALSLTGGFFSGFLLSRLHTHGISSERWPRGNTVIKGHHIHHFVPGILIAFLAGGAGSFAESERGRNLSSLLLGFGAGMTFDEAALLLHLEDVYWEKEGALSVKTSLAASSILGGMAMALRRKNRP